MDSFSSFISTLGCFEILCITPSHELPMSVCVVSQVQSRWAWLGDRPGDKRLQPTEQGS